METIKQDKIKSSSMPSDDSKNWNINNLENNESKNSLIPDDGNDIMTEAEKLALGWPEATKWNWTGTQGHYGEDDYISVTEKVKMAQQRGKYMSKRLKDLDNINMSYN